MLLQLFKNSDADFSCTFCIFPTLTAVCVTVYMEKYFHWSSNSALHLVISSVAASPAVT